MSSLDAMHARFARNEGLPFADILTKASIQKVLNEYGVLYRDRVFSPVTTIWGFLSQVLSEDRSCRDTVSRIIAHRAASGMAVCSPNTASYCNARSRIPTHVLSTLARRTAEELHGSVDDRWKWNGRSVFILDGSSVSMPDTPENQAMYPQPPNHKPGIGFPLARIGDDPDRQQHTWARSAFPVEDWHGGAGAGRLPGGDPLTHVLACWGRGKITSPKRTSNLAMWAIWSLLVDSSMV
jgi:hypothetical protein